MKCERCDFSNPPESLTCEKCHEKLYVAKLRVTYDNGQDETYFLFPQKYTLGRDPENQIALKDASVSRNHAEIDFQDGAFLICDKKSKNGSLLNNEHFHIRKLHDLDCIQLGNVVMHFYDEKNSSRIPRQGEATEEWVLREFFKFSGKQTKVTTNDVLLTMIELSLSLVHADQALVLQFDSASTLRFKVGKKPQGQTIFENRLSQIDRNIINESMRNKQPKIVYKEYGRPIPEGPSWSKMAIPLISTKVEKLKKDELGVDGVLGAFYLTQNRKRKNLSSSKMDLLASIVQQIVFAVENDMLYDETLAKRKIQEELTLARQIQERLLPIVNPDSKKFDIASYIHPCEAVSGDYFDFIPIHSEPARFGLAIGDICGKGIPAALLSSTVLAAIRSQLEYTVAPEQIIRNLNRLLIRSTAESIFLTLFFGIVDTAAGVIKYINAGHPPPIHIDKNGIIKELSGTTPALGILESQSEYEHSSKFERGDLLLLYTDGIIECQNLKKKIYGRKRLLKLLHNLFIEKKSKRLKLETIINRITADVKKFIGSAKQADDLTLLAIRRR
ncbi:MAG TPA: SpoIIE family protein phosphatase [bacterium]